MDTIRRRMIQELTDVFYTAVVVVLWEFANFNIINTVNKIR